MTIDGFKQKFFRYTLPYWKVYRGGRAVGTIIEKNTQLENVEESWDFFEETMAHYAAGQYTVVILGSASSKNSSGVHTVLELGDPSVLPKATTASTNSSFAQIQSLMQVMTFMQQFQQGPDIASLEARIEQKYKIMRLEEQLKTQQLMSPKEQLMEGFANSIPAMVSGFLGVPMPAPQPTQVGIAGGGESGQATATANSSGARRFPDLNRLAAFAHHMQKRYPQYYINDLLDAVFIYSQQQPAMADQLVETVMKNVHDQKGTGKAPNV